MIVNLLLENNIINLFEMIVNLLLENNIIKSVFICCSLV